MTLVEFLTARLDEDEAAALAASGPKAKFRIWYVDPWYGGEFKGALLITRALGPITSHPIPAEAAEHAARHDPDHALRVVTAHRRTIDRYVDLRDRCEVAWSDYSDWLEGKPGAGNAPGVSSHDPAIRDELERVLRDLASAYAGHGDYQEAWR